jgi:hypothetical protein
MAGKQLSKAKNMESWNRYGYGLKFDEMRMRD